MNNGLIAYIGGMVLPDKNPAAYRIVANARILRDLGYEVILLGLDQDCNASNQPTQLNISHFGFECWNIRYPFGLRDMYHHLTGQKVIKKFLSSLIHRGLKIVICYNYPSIAQYQIQNFCRHNDVKHIADVTEWYDTSNRDYISKAIKYIDTSFRMHKVNKRSDAIITTSNQVTNFYSQYHSNIIELPTLFDTKAFKHKPYKTELNKEIKLIYVGNPFEVKRANKNRTNIKERLDITIESVFFLSKKIPIKLDIYGITIDKYLSVFPRHAVWLKQSQNSIKFHGIIENSQARHFISQADFLIFFRDPSRRNLSGFPTKLAESISCGTPVITSALPNLKRYKTLGTIFFAEPGKEQSTMEKVLLSKSAHEISRLKRVCYESKAFDYRKFISDVGNFISRLNV